MKVKEKTRACRLAGTMALALILAPVLLLADDDAPEAKESQSAEAPSEDAQDAMNKALDSTATQWSFQFAYQVMPDYHQDTLDNGQTPPAGSTDYLQARIVAPVPLKGFTILPRVTLRHYKNAQGQSGLGNTEIFALIIAQRSRLGIGTDGYRPARHLAGQ